MEEYVGKKLILAIFLKRFLLGDPKISLKNEDIKIYASKLEVLFQKMQLSGGDLFVKTPVEETYDVFKFYLIDYIYGSHVASINDRYDCLVINCTDWYAYKQLREMAEYKDIINIGCLLLKDELELDEIPIIKQKTHE